MTPYYQSKRFTLYNGDCLTLMAELEANSIDAIVTDPPAGISFMGKDWDHHKGGRDAWVAWLTEVMRECLRVLKPGGHALVWALPRTSHWTGWAIESAGFEVRDRVSHLFGSGFPKSLDVSRAVDGYLGVEPKVVGTRSAVPGVAFEQSTPYATGKSEIPVTEAGSWAARQWQGYGTALKPACEDWWLCRKPIEGTVAQNVLKHGTGGLNIDGCRIETAETLSAGSRRLGDGVKYGLCEPSTEYEQNANGRWPANVIHDGSDEVLAGFPETTSGGGIKNPVGGALTWKKGSNWRDSGEYEGDSGSAARFFYCSKSSKADRDEGLADIDPSRTTFAEGTGLRNNGDGSPRNQASTSRNFHTTVKATALMRWLCRLITPPCGLILDPFMGSGSTGKAAMIEGFRFIGIEANPDYCALAQRRIEAVTTQPGLFTPEQLAGVKQPRTSAQEGLFAIAGE